MWAMVLSALAPTVAQAMVAASDKAQWVEVCSASGMITLKVDVDSGQEGTSDQGSPMSDMTQQCAWCVFHGAAADLPPVNVAVSAPPVEVELVPVYSGSVYLSLQWTDTQARAPPIAS